MAERIDIHPYICNGRPVIAGTRILVQTVMEFLGAGDSIDEVLEAYPSLKRFAAWLMANRYQLQGIA